MSVTKVTTDLPNNEQGDVCQIVSPGLGVTITSLPYPPSINMTFSIWWRAIGSETSIEIDAVGVHENVIVPIEWTRYSVVADPPDGRDIDITPSDSTPIQICMAQLEQGGSPSDWHPAPEDNEEADEANRQAIVKITPEYIISTVSDSMSEKFNSLETSIYQNAREISLKASSKELSDIDKRLKETEIKVTQEAITLAVTSSQEYKKDMYGPDGVSSRLSRAEQKITDDSIANAIKRTTVYKNDLITVDNVESKITATYIENKVGNTTYNPGDPNTSTYARMSSIRNTADSVTARVSSMRSGGTNLLIRAGMIRTHLVVENGTFHNPDADLTDENYTGPSTTNYYIPVSSQTKDFTINLYDLRTEETGLYMIFCEYDEEMHYIGYQEWPGLVEQGNRTFTVSDNTRYIRATVDGYPRYRWKLEHGNMPSDWSGANEELVVSSEMKITANQVLFKTPEFVVDIYDASSAEKALKIDKDGAQFTKVYAPNVAKVYVGSNAVNISSEIELHNLISTISNSVLTGNLTIYLQTNLTCSFKLSGVSGTGIIRFHGNGLDLVYDAIDLENCSVPVYFYNIHFNGNKGDSDSDYNIHISACKYVYYFECIFQGSDSSTQRNMFYAYNDSTLTLDSCEFYHTNMALEMHCSKLLMIGENKGNNLTPGSTAPLIGPAFEIYSSVVLLRGTRPDGPFDVTACLCTPTDPESLPTSLGDITEGRAEPNVYSTYFDACLTGTYTIENYTFKGNNGGVLTQGFERKGPINIYTYCGWIYFNLPSGINPGDIVSATLYLTRLDTQSGLYDVGVGLMSGTGYEQDQHEVQYNSRSASSVVGTTSNTDVNKAYDVTDKIRTLLDQNSAYYRGRLTLNYQTRPLSWDTCIGSTAPVLLLETTSRIRS